MRDCEIAGLRKNVKAQSFSTDVIIVVVIVLFAAVFLVINQVSNEKKGPSLDEKVERVSLEADVIVSELRALEVVKDDNSVDVEKLVSVKESELRYNLGISGKFCIVFHKNGKLVKVDSQTNIHGIGSSDIIVNNQPCR